MKKMIFMASAFILSNVLLLQPAIAETANNLPGGSEPGRVDADPAYDANIGTNGNTADQGTAANNTDQDTAKPQKKKKHAKKRSHTTVAVPCMKDKPPIEPPKEEEKPVSFLDYLSGNMTLTSNYVFRGISQTRNLPAVQGSLTYQLPVGVYANVWGSNVKFLDTDATVELDSIAGWRGDFWEDYSLDVNFARYNYPGATELSYNELNSVFNYKILQLGYSYSGDAFATHGVGRYYLIGLNYDIPPEYIYCIENVSVHATTGHFTLPRAAGNSYNDYSAWISKGFKNYLLTLQWTGTNGRQHSAPIDSNHIFALLTAEF